MLLGSIMLTAGYLYPPPLRLWAEDEWTDDPDAYDQAVQAATMVLEAVRPEGAHSSNSTWGVDRATDLIKAVRGDAGAAKKPFARGALTIRCLLGSTIAHRMKIRDNSHLPVTPPAPIPDGPRASGSANHSRDVVRDSKGKLITTTKARITRRKVQK